MMKTSIALSIGTVLALAGCGGGGGDSEARALVPLSTANYDAIANDLVSSISGTGPIFTAFEGVLSADADTGVPVSPYAVLATGKLGPIAALALTQVRAAPAQRERAQAVYSYTEPCVSGSLQVSENDADNNGDVSPGDTMTLVAKQCVFESGQPAVSGQLSLRVNAVSFDRFGDVTSASVGMTFTGFTVAGVSLNGAATVSANADSVTLAYQGLTARVADHSLVYNYTLAVRESGLTVNGQLTLNGSTYGLSTPRVISMGYYYPNGGQLRITDGHGAYVLSTFQSQGYVNRLFLAGDDLVDATSTLHPW
jgi:hypothetical protein